MSFVDTTSPGVVADLKNLVDTPGSGNVDDLAKNSLRYAGTEFTGEHYNSGLQRSTAAIAEAQPLDGSDLSSDQLEAIAREALNART
ncbi:hypothetical protein [Saccharopolyspora sp. ASAGF58]|uniref:hypothetical protein n=1 Tax=Saccharopolyspora sp. ASAGF58 TaxID=2719023 RepID=UPI001440304A|nr:hypothetical protein [Saccharopolyspora sp. ASAGF58]QIZ38245.1 hypothetical protein FDZ84_31460 [Saccharopolyspora sp. ASAGF58]